MDVTISQILGSVWVQGGLVAAALASIGFDKADTLKALPGKLSAKWTAWRAGKTATVVSVDFDSWHATLIGMRHKASELGAGPDRDRALALCDEMDLLAGKLSEAA